jgi:hypothetical protein
MLRLVEEGMGAPNQGLSRANPQMYRIVRFSVNQPGTVNDQLLAGFRPNPYRQSWQRLAELWGVPWTNRAFTDGWFFCFSDCVERYQREYAEFVERGGDFGVCRFGHASLVAYPRVVAILFEVNRRRRSRCQAR